MTRRRTRFRPVIPVGLVLVFAVAGVVYVAVAAGPANRRPGRHHQPTSGRRHKTHRRGHTSSSPQPVAVSGHWKLILDSEFNGRKLDTGLWRPGWFGSGITGPINKHESACYSASNVGFADGSLRLTVSRVRSRCSHRVRPFTGAVLSTNPHDGRAGGGFAYRYGVLEAKIYIPATSDARIADWPGVITLGQVWPRDGEDDVFENLGGLVCSHFHSPGYAPGGDLGGCDPSFSAGWHVVSSNWEPGSVTWYYDGIEIAHATRGITSAPMYLVLVNTTSSKSPQVATPDQMRVDYVRVWQRASADAR